MTTNEENPNHDAAACPAKNISPVSFRCAEHKSSREKTFLHSSVAGYDLVRAPAAEAAETEKTQSFFFHVSMFEEKVD